MLRHLCVLASTSLMVLGTPASAFDSSGTGNTLCLSYNYPTIKFDSGVATSATHTDYSFHGTGQFAEAQYCDKVGKWSTEPVKIDAQWDQGSKRAREYISHGQPIAQAFSEIISQCPSDPWQKRVSCILLSQKSTRADGSDISWGNAYDGALPMTSYAIGAAAQKLIAGAVQPYQGFVLPPNTAPVIHAPGADTILRRGQPLTLEIYRPIDGSDSWYAANKLTYDLEWEVKASFGDGAGAKMAIAPNWVKHNVLASADRTASPISIGNTMLYASDAASFAVEGGWNLWRVRVRLHDAVAVRPWSAWTNFFSEPPMMASGLPIAVDKLSAAPLAKKTEGALPAGPGIAPPAVKPATIAKPHTP